MYNRGAGARLGEGVACRLGEGVASLFGMLARTLGSSAIGAIYEQAAEPECTLSIASLVSPPESCERAHDVALLLQQNSEIDCTSRLAELFRTTEGHDGAGRIAQRCK